MIRWLDDLKIGAKLVIAPMMAILGIIGLAVGAYLVLLELRADFRFLNDQAFARYSQAAQLKETAHRMRGELNALAAFAANSDDAKALQLKVKNATASVDQLLGSMRTFDTGVDSGARRAVDASVHEYVDRARHAITMIGLDPATGVIELISGEAAFGKMNADLDLIATAAENGRTRIFTGALASINRAIVTFVSIVAGCLVLAAAVSALMIRAIDRPITRLTSVMGRLTTGETALEVPDSARGDEIGAMARAVQSFRDGLIERARLEAEAAAERGATDRRQAALNQHTQAFGASMSAVMTGLANASDGMRQAAQEMSQSAGDVRSEASATANGAAQASQDLVAVAAAVEEMTTTAGEIARQSGSAAAVARDAVRQAKSSREAMQGLVQATETIGDVVRLISSIAGQTSLLALNATIEAARAGNAGKGFAVVAGEVKALAAQTSKATAEIGQQIASVQGATQQAVSAMEVVDGFIGKMDEFVTAISAAVEEQSATTRQIAASLQSVSGTTTRTAQAMDHVAQVAGRADEVSQDVLAGSTDIRSQASRLHEEVDRFLQAVRTDTGERRRAVAL